MKRYASDRTAKQPKPVERVEVKEGHVKLRTVMLIVAILVAVAAFVYAVSALFRVETGWREVEVTSSDVHCGQDFEFTYYLGASGVNAATEMRTLTSLYTQACVDAYRIFNTQEHFDGMVNLFDLNRRINTPVQVHPALYRALEVICRLDSRYAFLAPVYTEYNSLFFCNEDWETAGYDPYQNEDIAAYMAEAAAFARDPQAVDLVLLGDHTVQLNVSEDYQAFCRENGVMNVIDLYWMQDAFIIDYLAEVMEQNGFTRGAISSYDGYVRCLSESQLTYAYNFYDTAGEGKIANVARLDYPGGTALAHLRAFPLNSQKEVYYYRFADGSVRVPYADLADGKSKAVLPAMVVTSRQMGCAETLLRALPLYAADALDETALAALPAAGVYPLYCQAGRITVTDPAMQVGRLAEGYVIK